MHWWPDLAGAGVQAKNCARTAELKPLVGWAEEGVLVLRIFFPTVVERNDGVIVQL